MLIIQSKCCYKSSFVLKLCVTKSFETTIAVLRESDFSYLAVLKEFQYVIFVYII